MLIFNHMSIQKINGKLFNIIQPHEGYTNPDADI